MNKKIFSILGGVLALALVQFSFTPHFIFLNTPFFTWINLISLAVVIIVLFEHRQEKLSWLAALEGGLLLDIYSTKIFFGFWTVIFFGLVAIIKLVLKQYVRIPSFW